MSHDYDHILIFRSNVQTEGDRYRISAILDMHPLIEQWCVDLDDDERILRVVTSKLNQKNIVDMISGCGYTCEELKD